MGLSVTARGANAPAHAPIYSAMLHTDSMLFAIAPTSSHNAFDLSDHYRPTTISGSPVFTERGMRIAGLGGLAVPSVQPATINSYTMMGVIFLDNVRSTLSTSSAVLMGDFDGASDVATNASGVLSLDFASDGLPQCRAFFGAKNRNSAASFNFGRNTPLPTSHFSNAGDNFTIRPIFIAATIDITSNPTASTTAVYFKSHQVEQVNGSLFNATTVENDFYAASKLQQQPNGAKPLSVGFVSNNYDDPTTKNIAFARFDSRALSSQEIEDQYQVIKKWLLAEGVVDISHWC